jgi:hypothetical protein
MLKHVRTAMAANDGVSVGLAYSIAESVASRDWNPGRPPGTRVNDRNEVVPIKAPRQETMPTRRLATVEVASAIDDDEDIVSPDDPTEVISGVAGLQYVPEGEEGIVPELEPDPIDEDEDDGEGDEPCEA